MQMVSILALVALVVLGCSSGTAETENQAQDEALTRQAFHRDWLKTGDIGSIDRAGNIRITGRLRMEINRAGIKIHPEEVELLLEGHPAVAEACALGLPDPISGERLAVALRLQPGARADESALRDWTAQRIRRDCLPDQWFLLTVLPHSERGKLDRKAVRDLIAIELER